MIGWLTAADCFRYFTMRHFHILSPLISWPIIIIIIIIRGLHWVYASTCKACHQISNWFTYCVVYLFTIHTGTSYMLWTDVVHLTCDWLISVRWATGTKQSTQGNFKEFFRNMHTTHHTHAIQRIWNTHFGMKFIWRWSSAKMRAQILPQTSSSSFD